VLTILIITGFLSTAGPAWCREGPVGFSPVMPRSDAEERTNDDTPEPRDRSVGADVQPVQPAGALYRSMAFSGWGQLSNGKRFKAALFFTAETVCIAGYFYERQQVLRGGLNYYDREVSRTDRNTFFLYWLGIKVAGMIDAYVDAQLASFDVVDITPPELLGPKRADQ